MNIETGTWIGPDGTTQGTWTKDTEALDGSWAFTDGTSGGFILEDSSVDSGSWWSADYSQGGSWSLSTDDSTIRIAT